MHLFAGHGGGLLADLILGHRPIVAVEWDRYACQVLRERAADGWFPGLHVWEGDVRLFDPSEYAGQVDCIHAGFPCQDISVAGKQAGVSEGTRSGLYREVLRIAGVVRPKQLFLENVSAILSNGLGTVLGDLATLGYDCRWLCIRASDVGAPHHRDRWFALCNANTDSRNGSAKQELKQQRPEESGGGGAGQVESSIPNANSENWRTSGMGQNTGSDGRNESCGVGEILADSMRRREGDSETFDKPALDEERNTTTYREKRSSVTSEVGGNGAGHGFEDLADTNNQRCEELNAPGIAAIPGRDGGRTDAGWGGGWWETEPALGRVAHGIPNRVGQLKGYGNAQVPLQAATAYRLLGGQ